MRYFSFFLKKIFFFIFFFIFSGISVEVVFAQDRFTSAKNKDGITVQLRAEKPIYFLGERMLVEVEIINYSKSRLPYRFLVYKNLFQQFKFSCVDKDGHSPFSNISYESWKYTKDRTDLKIEEQIIKDLMALDDTKEVELAYGEAFRMRVDLRDYFEFDKEGRYFVSLDFFPISTKMPNYFFSSMQDQIEVRLGNAAPILNNPKTLMRPSFLNEVKSFRKSLSISEKGLFDFYPKSPTAVVEWHLKNQQEKNWKFFLLAFKLDEVLKNSYLSTDYYERFRSARDFEKPIVIDDFSQFLINSIDYRILRFEPKKTVIVGDEAKVSVIVDSVEAYAVQQNFPHATTGQEQREWKDLDTGFLKRSRVFVYSLRRLKNLWKIFAVELQIGLDDDDDDNDKKRSNKEIERVGFVYFDFNNSNLGQQYFPILKRIVDVLYANPDLKVLLVGYADDLGTEDYNLSLSNNRIESVFMYLKSSGIDQSRILRNALGEIKLDKNYRAEELRQQNRRVEISFFR